MAITEQTTSKLAVEKVPDVDAQPEAVASRKRTAAAMEEAIPAKMHKHCEYKAWLVSALW